MPKPLLKPTQDLKRIPKLVEPFLIPVLNFLEHDAG